LFTTLLSLKYVAQKKCFDKVKIKSYEIIKEKYFLHALVSERKKKKIFSARKVVLRVFALVFSSR
jgi:hypothetical protein